MKVVIVAKTRQGAGACIGAISFGGEPEAASGRSLRLIAPDAATNEAVGLEYNVGDVWEIEATPAADVIPPHIENVIVHNKRRLPPLDDVVSFIERHMPSQIGGPELLYAGLTQATATGALYISQQRGIPPYSTLFWRPDKPLQRNTEGKRIRYRYPVAGPGSDVAGCTLTFVGFQEPLAEIPAGTLLRVSLAHWWRPPDKPEEELRCFVQLSGWFTDEMRVGGWEMGGVDEQNHSLDLPISQSLYTNPQEALKQVFGYDEFRPLQADIIQNVLAKKDCVAVMPTGSGKSLCYQLPALLFPGLTVVVSPLISLMEDQVSALHELGVPATFLNSTLTYSEYVARMNGVRNGRVKLLYAAPETLLRPEILLLLEQCRVDCLTIDEAHCISQWGHDFRPEFRQLIKVRKRLPEAVCFALTATATPRVQQDILDSLGIPQAQAFIASFNRENLFLSVQPKKEVAGQTLSFLEDHRDESGIIYCATRKQVDLLSGLLAAKGWAVRPYHAGLDDATRTQNQRAFIRDDVPIIVATIAFGMGINKPNVRFVLHVDLPQDMESYYQQIGRAGRDGLRADCLLLYSYADVNTVYRFIEQMAPDQQKGASLRLAAMVQYAEAGVCRRRPLLTYFGEPYEAETCETCDNCLAEEQAQVDLTVPAQKFLSCVYRTGQFFGVNHIIDVLRGSRNQKILRRGHDKLTTYGIGLEWDKEQWKHLCTQLIQQGLLTQDLEHGSLKLTETAWPVLRGQAQFWGVMETARMKTAVTAPSEPLDYNRELFALLRQKRKELADAANVPPYVIFSDRTLVEMAAFYPQSRESLSRIYGIGQRKLDKYEDDFLPLIRDFCAAHNLVEVPDAQARQRNIQPKGQPGTRAQLAVEMYEKGKPVPAIADELGVKTSTVMKYLVEAVRGGRPLPPDNFRALSALSPVEQARVLAAFAELGPDFLRPVYDALGETVSFEELHILRLVYLCEQKS
jgi:ATP-dependent DNA helicase RecQ